MGARLGTIKTRTTPSALLYPSPNALVAVSYAEIAAGYPQLFEEITGLHPSIPTRGQQWMERNQWAAR